MTDAQNDIGAPNAEYLEMSKAWRLPETLLGGTQAMRDASKDYLPQEEAEKFANYKQRVARSFLFNAYQDTTTKLVAKPFSKPVTVQGDNLPDFVERIEADADLTGNDLTQFGRELFDSAIVYGLTHILVDYPTVSEGATKADEAAAGVRPIFAHVTAPQLIGWQSECMANGQMRLMQIRIREHRIEPDGLYGTKKVEYIRLYTETEFEIWKATDNKEVYIQVGGGSHTFGRVPLLTCYLTRTGFLVAKPPLEDLAWMNLAHWQSSSDQRNILRIARVGIIFAAGVTDEEYEKGLTIGPSQAVMSTNSEAKLEFVEHSGKAIGAGADDLKALEDRMEVLGLQPLIQKYGGNTTATGRAIDESRFQSSIQAWVGSLESTLTDAFKLGAEWVKQDLPDDFKVDIFNDFSITLKSGQDIESLLKARLAGEISHETYLREVKRRALLSESLDVVEEIERVDAEGPAMGNITAAEGTVSNDS